MHNQCQNVENDKNHSPIHTCILQKKTHVHLQHESEKIRHTINIYTTRKGDKCVALQPEATKSVLK